METMIQIQRVILEKSGMKIRENKNFLCSSADHDSDAINKTCIIVRKKFNK